MFDAKCLYAVAFCETAVFVPRVERHLSMDTAALGQANILAEQTVQAQAGHCITTIRWREEEPTPLTDRRIKFPF